MSADYKIRKPTTPNDPPILYPNAWQPSVRDQPLTKKHRVAGLERQIRWAQQNEENIGDRDGAIEAAALELSRFNLEQKPK